MWNVVWYSVRDSSDKSLYDVVSSAHTEAEGSVSRAHPSIEQRPDTAAIVAAALPTDAVSAEWLSTMAITFTRADQYGVENPSGAMAPLYDADLAVTGNRVYIVRSGIPLLLLASSA